MANDRSAALEERVGRRLAEMADEGTREGQRRFFREDVESLGVGAPALRALAAEIYRAVKDWPPGERERLFNRLWKWRKLEGGGLVCYVARRFAGEFGSREFGRFAAWFDLFIDNWAACDGVATWLVAACLENEPELCGKLRAWTRSRNRWARRGAAVSLVREAKRGRHPETIFEVADALLDDRDDMVEKGVGWLLKETYPRRPGETVAFLAARRGRASRTTLRYAAEKMTAADRETVLRRV